MRPIRTAEALVRDTYVAVAIEHFPGDLATGDVDVYVVTSGKLVLSCQLSESRAWLLAAMTI